MFKLFLALVLFAIPFTAAAQETDSSVSLDPFISEVMPYLLALLSAVATAALAWITKKVHDWTGITIEARHREALQSALMNGARAAMAKVVPKGVAVDINNVAIREGVKFVLESVPDAVAYFGLTPADIEKHLTPKLVAIAGGQ